MSNPGFSFTDAPDVFVGASEAKVGAAVPARTNGALQLAESLQGLNSKIAPLAGAVIREDMDVQKTAAKKRALELGGQQLADAVREGKIEATQNPFFIQDYNRESAYVRAQQAITQMRVDSQTWPEQSDPIKYQQRYFKELGEIGSAYDTDPDTQEGFQAAAAPAAQQDLAANTAERVQAIKADRLSVMANLVAQSVQNVQSANGGKPAPNQVWDSIAGLKQQFLSTGGSPQEWDKLVANGVTAAALQQNNAGLLDLLKDSKSGTTGAIYNLPGQAQDIETTKYRITQATQEKGRQEYYDAMQKDYFDSRNYTKLLYDKFGAAAFTGAVPVDDMIATLKENGAPVAGLMGALNKVQSTVGDYQGLAEARFKSFASTADGQHEIMDLNMVARTQGYTPELEARLSEHVLNQDLPATTANSIIGQAIETSRASTGGRFLPKDAKAALQGYTSTGSAIDQAATGTMGKLDGVLRSKGASPMSMAEKAAVVRQARAVANYYLRGNPGDYAGATREASNAIGDLIRQTLSKRLKAAQQKNGAK